MHYVNLIAKRRALQVTAKRVARVGSMGVLVALILTSVSVGLLLTELRMIEARAASRADQATRLAPTLARYRHAKQTQDQEADFARYYLQARKSQDQWLRWLTELQRRLPADTWLGTIDTQTQAGTKTLVINGYALSETSIAGFVRALASSPELQADGASPRIDFIRLVQQGNKDTHEFQVSVPLSTNNEPVGAGGRR